MRQEAQEPLSLPLVLHLHRQLFHYSDGRGGYLKTDPNRIVPYEGGHREIILTLRRRRRQSSC